MALASSMPAPCSAGTEADVLEPDTRTGLQLDMALQLSFAASDPPAISLAPPQPLERDTSEGEYE